MCVCVVSICLTNHYTHPAGYVVVRTAESHDWTTLWCCNYYGMVVKVMSQPDVLPRRGDKTLTDGLFWKSCRSIGHRPADSLTRKYYGSGRKRRYRTGSSNKEVNCSVGVTGC